MQVQLKRQGMGDHIWGDHLRSHLSARNRHQGKLPEERTKPVTGALGPRPGRRQANPPGKNLGNFRGASGRGCSSPKARRHSYMTAAQISEGKGKGGWIGEPPDAP